MVGLYYIRGEINTALVAVGIFFKSFRAKVAVFHIGQLGLSSAPITFAVITHDDSPLKAVIVRLT